MRTAPLISSPGGTSIAGWIRAIMPPAAIRRAPVITIKCNHQGRAEVSNDSELIGRFTSDGKYRDSDIVWAPNSGYKITLGKTSNHYVLRAEQVRINFHKE